MSSNSRTPTPATKPISPSDIRAVVSKEDDFGHEMRVGRIIRGIPAVKAEHGGTYTDTITRKPRQFDYRCSLTKELAHLFLAVECKNITPNVPLVICGADRQDNESFHDLIESRNGHFKRRSAIINGSSSITRRASGADSIYPPGHFVGKSIVRIQADKTPMVRTSDSDIYDKWAQAISSAVGLAESACGLAFETRVNKCYAAIVPAVVVPDNLLWIAAYDQNGNISVDPKQVDECELFVAREIEVGGGKGTPLFHRITFSHVHLFALSGFAAFLSKMAVNEHAWSALFTSKSIEL